MLIKLLRHSLAAAALVALSATAYQAAREWSGWAAVAPVIAGATTDTVVAVD